MLLAFCLTETYDFPSIARWFLSCFRFLFWTQSVAKMKSFPFTVNSRSQTQLLTHKTTPKTDRRWRSRSFLEGMRRRIPVANGASRPVRQEPTNLKHKTTRSEAWMTWWKYEWMRASRLGFMHGFRRPSLFPGIPVPKRPRPDLYTTHPAWCFRRNVLHLDDAGLVGRRLGRQLLALGRRQRG